MEQSIAFRCVNCGNTVEKDLLPGKHTVLGEIRVVNREASCCGDPDYRDGQGYRKKMVERSFREFIPGLRA
ncbi:MAG: hypothetical protein ABEJ66_03010 [Candidatus Nanohaloarchaea archaeon]